MTTLPNICFYSRRPDDKYSREILEELEKNKLLKSQCLLIDVDKEKIPDKIKKLQIIPVLITNGINHPITGTAIITWLKNGSFQSNANGYQYGAIDEKQSDFSVLGDEFSKSDYNQYHNKEYNLGFLPKKDVLKEYSSRTENSHIDLYDSSKEKKIDNKTMVNKLKTMNEDRGKINLPFSVPEKFKYENNSNNSNNPNNPNNSNNSNNPNNQLTYNPNVYISSPKLPFPINKPPYINNRNPYI